MEKATLLIRKTKKGNFVADLKFASTGKTMPFQNFKPKNDSMNNQEVDVERVKGKIVKVRADGNVIYDAARSASAGPSRDRRDRPRDERRSSDRSRSAKPGSARSAKQADNVRYPAHAPYNFIPLNDTVVEDPDAVPSGDQYHQGRHTGWIDVAIKTETPLYIRDTLTQAEMKEKARLEEQARKDNKQYQYTNPNFFSPGGKLRIPGSSLRGMVRTLVEIVSFGKFGAFDDKRLYFRSFADIARNLRDEYVKNMIYQKDGAYTIAPIAGYLKRTRANQYVIVPAVETPDKTTYYKVEESLLRKKPFYPHTMAISFTNRQGKTRYKPNSKYKFLTKLVEFKKQPPQKHRHSNVSVYYGKVTAIQAVTGSATTAGWERGTLVCTGWIPSRRQGKHMHWVVNQEDSTATALAIEDDLLKSYKDDVNREDQADLLKQLEKHPDGVPCFYIQNEEGRVISFGHTGMFRLAYEKTISDHIPDHLKDPNTRDIPESIFGNEETFAGRVFFEDAFLDEGQKKEDVLMGERTPKILSSPKPTTFQHYLVQTGDDPQQLNHYNTNAPIRGNKLYWHRPGTDWEETDQEAIKKHQSQYTKIDPVRPGVTFTGRIRFENLSDVELGALLFSLKLPEGCKHKLGMGKPLGLGSVAITPTLHLSNRETRYTDVLAEWTTPPTGDEDQMDMLIEKFEAHVLAALGESPNKKLWDTSRLQELETMLNYKKGLERQLQTLYMQITPNNEFKDRPVLPHSSEIPADKST